MNSVAQLISVNDNGLIYKALHLWCPGCEITDPDGRKHAGLKLLPISGSKKWEWNKDLVIVTLNPSILTKTTRDDREFVCHSYLHDGRWSFLNDCTHSLANQTAPMLPLPDWIVRR